MDVRKMEERKNGRRKILIIGITLVLLTVSLSGCNEKPKTDTGSDTQGAAVLPGLDEGQEKNESPPVEQSGQVKILFESLYYFDERDGYFPEPDPELYGEIQNTGETLVVVKSIVISIYKEYDKSDGSKGSYFVTRIEGYPVIGLLEPGQKTPFHIPDPKEYLSDYKTLQDRKDLTWEVIWGNTAVPRIENIEVLNIREADDPYKYVFCYVKVQNLVDEHTLGYIVATFYNDESRVINYINKTFDLYPEEVKDVRIDTNEEYSDYTLQVFTIYNPWRN